MVVYEIQDLVKIYPGQKMPANDGISLQIVQGEIFGILGDNGAGKSTLVRQMVNLIRPTRGTIRLYGQPVDTHPYHVPQHIGYMPQEALALNNLTVGEALYFTAHLRGLNHSLARRERDYWIDYWQLGALRGSNNQRLSGGEKRLLLLSVAMIANPEILILDEPTNDLDPLRRNRVWEAIRQLNRVHGTTILFITHDAIEAEKVIQRVGIMRKGKLVAIGKPNELKSLVDQKLRLELFFSPESPPLLPPGLKPVLIDHGRWLVYIDRQEANIILNYLNFAQVDDFRLYSATLEDLYLHYANQD